MGTAVGSNGIGVAPGAKWIGCRNMRFGSGSPSTYMGCFDFFLSPGGDTSKRPHVMINSWGCPASEGCDSTSLRVAVESARAAGIVVIVSAGNSGTACSTINVAPANHNASITIGAIASASNTLASFSSVGPTLFPVALPKPDLVAPGVGTLSSVAVGSGSGSANYQTFQGTSMAGPHVVGCVALLLDACPWLIRNVDAVETLLKVLF